MTDTHTFHIKGMTCGHCARTVERTAREVPGVQDAEVDLAQNTLRLQGAPDTAALVAAIRDAGYDVEDN